ncbi:MAG: hypothetical protein KDA93_15265 [Planctomycetaceae bacterium]|nr:hypothetical protein [Planctomycetaceae bacterium]
MGCELAKPQAVFECGLGSCQLWLRISLVVFALIHLSSRVHAKDRVVVQPPENVSPLVISGDIVDYTSKIISLHINDELPIRTFPADQVISVEAVQTEAHREGVTLYNTAEIDKAVGSFQQALEDESRKWVQCEILGWLVRCATRQRDRVTAATRYLQLVEIEPSPREAPLIPLVWDTAETSTSLRQNARTWLTSHNDVARLLGASVLLLEPAYGDVTCGTLRRIVTTGDETLEPLARAQLWRLRVTQDVTQDEFASWGHEIQRMPSTLRAGPYFVLGRTLVQQSEYDRAAAAFLWLTTVHRENEPLAAQATVYAGTALMRLGRADEARSLWQEVVSDWRWTPAAAEARGLIDQTTPTRDARTDG